MGARWRGLGANGSDYLLHRITGGKKKLKSNAITRSPVQIILQCVHSYCSRSAMVRRLDAITHGGSTSSPVGCVLIAPDRFFFLTIVRRVIIAWDTSGLLPPASTCNTRAAAACVGFPQRKVHRGQLVVITVSRDHARSAQSLHSQVRRVFRRNFIHTATHILPPNGTNFLCGILRYRFRTWSREFSLCARRVTVRSWCVRRRSSQRQVSITLKPPSQRWQRKSLPKNPRTLRVGKRKCKDPQCLVVLWKRRYRVCP